MSKYLRHSTASQEILLGYFVDSTDGNTQETALTIANTDIRLFKEGATTLVSKNSGGGTHISNGLYSAVLDATDTNTLGKLDIRVHVTGALAFEDSYTVLPANVFDSLILGTDLLDANTAQIGGASVTDDGPVPLLGIVDQGTAQSATSTSIVLRAASSFANDTIIGCTIAAFGSDQGYWQFREITDYVLSTDTATVDTWTVTPSGTITYRVFLGVPAPAAPPSVNVVQISGDATAADNAEAFFDGTGYAGTNNVIPTVTNLTNAPANGDLTATMKASVNAEVDAALADIHLDHLLATTYDPASKPGVADALLNELVESDAGVARFTANALEQAPAGGGGGASDWNADERTAIRTILGIPASGTTPEVPSAGALRVIDDLVDDLESRLTSTRAGYLDNLSAGAVALEATAQAILTDTGTTGVLIATGGVNASALATDAVNEIADGILDRNMATGTDSGSSTVRTVRQALRPLRNRVAVSGGTATVYREDDSTTSWTAVVTTTAGDPISEVNPAGGA